MKEKRGLSPVIATVLLVAIVIVIALIVFLWFRGITDEAITKFDGTNVKLVCEEVTFQAEYSGGTLRIVNDGNVPIYQMKAKIYSDGSYETKTLETGWPNEGLNQGGTYSGPLSGSPTEIILIPVLLGKTEDGRKAYTCDDRFGVDVFV